MKYFFPISNDFYYYPAFQRLIADYGTCAVAFYFMALGMMAMNGGWQWKKNLLGLRRPGLRILTIEQILFSSELFEEIEEGVVLIADIERNGVTDFHKSIFYNCRKEKPWVYARTRSCAPTRTRDRAPGQAPGQAPSRPQDGVCAGPIDANAIEEDIEKEIDTEKKKTRWLSLFFQSNCPHLLEMEEPMTVEQFDDLVKRFGIEEVKSVLCDMENETSLNKRSCAHTAESWLKGRVRRLKNKNETV